MHFFYSLAINNFDSPAPVFQNYISSFEVDSLQNNDHEIRWTDIDSTLSKVEIVWHLKDTVRQADWKVQITPNFKANFHWQPHLTPTDNHIIAQHVFRAPALILADSVKQLTLIPDLSGISNNGIKWFMDLDARTNVMTIGIANSKVTSHVLFEKDPGIVIPPGEFKFSFYLMTSSDSSSLHDPWRKPLAFLWTTYGDSLYKQGQPIKGSLEPYVKHTYNWAFNTWKKAVWQEFKINGKKVGAPVFIVNVTQSPNYPAR
ncbi:MAG: hypothetical protein WDO15_28685 [Bacteroidota bacterium]